MPSYRVLSSMLACPWCATPYRVDQGSAVKWRNAYIKGGLAGMLAHGKKRNGPSVIQPHQREVLYQKLHDLQNGLRGYTGLVPCSGRPPQYGGDLVQHLRWAKQ